MRGVNKRNKIIIIYMYIFLEIIDLIMYSKSCSIINFACKGNE